LVPISKQRGLAMAGRVALVCNYLSSNMKDNLRRGAVWIDKAGHNNGDLVCFGEYAFQGKEEDDYEKDISMADTIPGSITTEMGKLSKRHSLYVATGILERESGVLYDSAVLIDYTGKIVLKYRRISPQWHGKHADKNRYREGKNIRTALTPLGKVGIIICGDFFDDSVLARVKKVMPDCLVVPVAVPIADFEPSYGSAVSEKWATYKGEWIDQERR